MELLARARKFAELSNKHIRDNLKSKLTTCIKGDGSPVTTLDRSTEKVLREAIEAAYPEHDILGEEYERISKGSDFQWTIDPIDGTKNFISGLPGFGTLIGLRYRGNPVIGIVDLPMMKRQYYGGFKLGCYCNNKKISCAETESDVVFSCCRSQYEKVGHGGLFFEFISLFPELQICNDPFSQTQAIEGNAAATIEFGLKLWDRTPIELLVSEAGGLYTCLSEDKQRGVTLYSSVFGSKQMVERITEIFHSQQSWETQ